MPNYQIIELVESIVATGAMLSLFIWLALPIREISLGILQWLGGTRPPYAPHMDHLKFNQIRKK
jgi:hypothetical protein